MNDKNTGNKERLQLLVNKLESAVDCNRLTVSLHFNPYALARIQSNGIKLISQVPSGDTILATLDLINFRKYIDLCCSMFNLELSLDGTLTEGFSWKEIA